MASLWKRQVYGMEMTTNIKRIENTQHTTPSIGIKEKIEKKRIENQRNSIAFKLNCTEVNSHSQQLNSAKLS